MENSFVQQVPVGQLVCRPQVRNDFSAERLLGLRESIRENGILVPLLAHPEAEKLRVDDGECRLRMAIALGLETVPVIVTERALSSVEITQFQLVINSQRHGLNPIEKSNGLVQLMREGSLSLAQAASKIGLSEGLASKLVSLLRLCEDVQHLVATGRLPLSTAYEISRVEDRQQQKKLADAALKGQLTREQVAEQAAPQRSRGAHRRRASGRAACNRVQVPLGDGRSITVVGPGLTVESLVSWVAAFLERLRSAATTGVELKDLVKALAAQAA